MGGITETSEPIEERESNNILKPSFKNASKYMKHQTRRETITLTIPAEFLEGDKSMVINTAALRRQCEMYVKQRLETSFRMNNADVAVQENEEDLESSSTAPEVPVDDDGSINKNPADRKKVRRSNTVTSSSSEGSACNKKPDPPTAKKGDQSFRDHCIQSRDRCIQTVNNLSTRSIRTFDDVSARGFRTFERLTRRQLLCIAAGLIVFIMINIVIGIATSDRSHPVSTGLDGPTEPPTFDLYSGSGEYLRTILDEMEPLNKDAFNWLKNIDSWEAPRHATNIDQLWVERYVLAAFYFSTVTAEKKWKSSEKWLSDESVCVWQGVKCNVKDEVSEIVLCKKGKLIFVIE